MLCPACKKELQNLLLHLNAVYEVGIDGKTLHYTIYDEDEFTYYCPNCLETLAYSEEEVIKLLEGK